MGNRKDKRVYISEDYIEHLELLAERVDVSVNQLILFAIERTYPIRNIEKAVKNAQHRKEMCGNTNASRTKKLRTERELKNTLPTEPTKEDLLNSLLEEAITIHRLLSTLSDKQKGKE